MTIQISIHPQKVFRVLCAIIVFLVIMSTLMIAAFYFNRWPEGSPMYQAVKIFWLDTEANLPTLYQALTLLLSAFLLEVISLNAASTGKSYVFHWRLMAIIFFWFGVDEASHIHEVVQALFSQFFRDGILVKHYMPSKILFFIPAILIVVTFVITYIRFLLYLPKRTRWQFILSGAIFVGGALGIEMVSQFFAAVHGKTNMVYGGLSSLEEIMEMVGIAIFIYALLEYLGRHSIKFQIHFSDDLKNPDSDGKFVTGM